MKSDEELLDEFIGKEHSPPRRDAEQTLREWPDRTPMAAVLFRIQTIPERCDHHDIVYREEDIRRLLEFLGYPVNFGNE